MGENYLDLAKHKNEENSWRIVKRFGKLHLLNLLITKPKHEELNMTSKHLIILPIPRTYLLCDLRSCRLFIKMHFYLLFENIF